MAQISGQISQELAAGGDELSHTQNSCSICSKTKKILYMCVFKGCNQSGRIFCKKCGKFTHTADDSDDSDGDEEDEKNKSNCDHLFDVNASYIVKYNTSSSALELSDDNLKQIKNFKDMHIMVKAAQENNISDYRVASELAVTNIASSLISLSLGHIPGRVANMKFWQPWGTKMLVLLKNGELSTFTSEISTAAFGMGDRYYEYTKATQEGAWAAAGITFIAETGYHTFRWCKGDITRTQYKQKVATAAAVSTGNFVGNVGGATLGACIGTYILPFIGTAACGAIGGVLGGIFGGIAAKKSMEIAMGEKESQKEKYALLKEALAHFGFEEEDLLNKNVFNAQTIGKKYRQLAKEKHPDAPGGSQEKFLLLTSRMTMLLAAVTQSNENLNAITKQFGTKVLKLKASPQENNK